MKTMTWMRAVAAAFALAAPAAAQTNVPPGPVSGLWTAAGSPYIVHGDILVIDLTIQAGVQVLVDGPFTIEVPGRIIATGTDCLPITFTANNAQNPWKGLEFNDTPPGSLLEHCIIEKSNDSGVRITSTSPQGVPPTLESCIIRDNTSSAGGGGIRANIAAGQPLRLDHCTVSGNTANPDQASGTHVGGGMYLSGSAELSECVFRNNRCWGRCGFGSGCSTVARGSALYCDGGGTVVIRKSEFVANEVGAWSACSVFTGCSTGLGSGALYVHGNAQVSVANCIIACNSSIRHIENGNPSVVFTSGGLVVGSGSGEAMNCTIAGNTSFAVESAGGAVAVHNSILFFNNGGGSQFSGAMDICYSNVQGALVPGCNNISVGPGFSPSACTACEFRLPSFSPCVDAGDPDPQYNDACRPPGMGAERNDMGRFGGPNNCWENPCYPDCNGDCTLNLADFGCFQTKFALADPYCDCNCDGALNLADFGCFQTAFALGCP